MAVDLTALWVGDTSQVGSGDGMIQEAGSQHLKFERWPRLSHIL